MVTDHAVERRREKDAVVMIGLEGKMQEMALQQRQFQAQEPDPDQWETHWQKLKTDFESQELGQADLSRAASRAMTHTLARYSQGHALRIREAAGHQSRQRLATAVTARIQAARTPEEVAQVRPLANAGGMADEHFNALAGSLAEGVRLRAIQGEDQQVMNLVETHGDEGMAQAISMVQKSSYRTGDEKSEKIKDITYAQDVRRLTAQAQLNPETVQLQLAVGDGPDRASLQALNTQDQQAIKAVAEREIRKRGFQEVGEAVKTVDRANVEEVVRTKSVAKITAQDLGAGELKQETGSAGNGDRLRLVTA
ncbi:hypothetical protein WJU23_17060 [Prosthecobacter sp. SYSU 5D2]|uniref:hypothetical protein n=1 Tax=Prosthecobacter sp. SYSU 5D2 TaxID=3134134 RepID=UPI0031FEC82E